MLTCALRGCFHLLQERERVERERVVREKVAAATFSRGYLSGIISTVFDQLQANGHFYDPVQREVEEAFMPWLKDQAVQYLSQGVITREVVKKLVEAASNKVAANRKEANARQKAAHAAAIAWARKQAEVAHALSDAESGRQHQLGSFILEDLQPRLVKEEDIENVREELQNEMQAKADAAYDEAKAKAAEEARATAEARAADQAAALEEARAKATEAAGEEGLPEGWTPEDAPEPVDVEAEVAAAVEEVKRPDVKNVTLDDVLSAMLDKGMLTKDAIMQAMAVDNMGDDAYFRQEVYTAPPPAPVPEAPKKK